MAFYSGGGYGYQDEYREYSNSGNEEGEAGSNGLEEIEEKTYDYDGRTGIIDDEEYPPIQYHESHNLRRRYTTGVVGAQTVIAPHQTTRASTFNTTTGNYKVHPSRIISQFESYESSLSPRMQIPRNYSALNPEVDTTEETSFA